MKKALIGLSLVLLLLPFVAFAADLRADENRITVSKSENPSNLYIGGQTVNVDGNVKKDLVAGGNSLTVNGDVESSIIAGANNITINGAVGNNIRTASSDMLVEGNVGGDITTVGSVLTIGKDSIVSGDIMAAGGTLEINGTVNGNVYYAGGKATINGIVKGDVKATVGSIVLGSNAVIEGKLTYWSQKQSDFDQSKVKGGVEFHKQAQNNFNFSGFWYFGLIMKTIMALILLLLVVFLMPRFAKNFSSETYKNIWKNLGWGVFSLFVIPIILVLLMITFFGIPLAFIFGLVFLLMITAAWLFTPLIVGSLIWKIIKRSESYEADWRVVLIGIVSVFILNIVPVIGWLALFVFFLFALGEVTMTIWGVLRKQKA